MAKVFDSIRAGNVELVNSPRVPIELTAPIEVSTTECRLIMGALISWVAFLQQTDETPALEKHIELLSDIYQRFALLWQVSLNNDAVAHNAPEEMLTETGPHCTCDAVDEPHKEACMLYEAAP